MSISIRKRLKSALRVKNPILKGMLAELLGTFVLVAFGNGSVAQVVLSRGTAGTFLTINLAWGFAVAMGVWVSGGVSGGQINPAVTLTLCLMGREQWRKLIPYWLAQYIGSFIASACVYGVYIDALNDYDGGTRYITGVNATAGIWSTFPKEFLSANVGLADQILATGLLVCMVLAVTDENNMAAPKGMVPLAVGLIVAVIGMSFGFNCGYAINPARDWGPRMFTAVAGWGSGVFSFRDNNWFWVPFVGPHIGAVLGAVVYQLCVGIHAQEDDLALDEVDDDDFIHMKDSKQIQLEMKSPKNGKREMGDANSSRIGLL